MSRVVHLHIGAPKTGTTYLQDRLVLNSAALGRHGVDHPARPRSATPTSFHFRAALDLLDQDWGGRPGHAKGAWDAMVRARATARDGNVVISHEILAGAKPDKIAKALNDLAGNEVHIVYSARDLGRQLPAAWQESIKQGRKWPFKRFLDQGRARHDVLLPAARWTCPPCWATGAPSCRPSASTSSPCRTTGGPTATSCGCASAGRSGIDPAWAPLDSERDNRSLGIAETSLLRKLNRRLELGVWRDPAYDALIRELLAQEVLVARDGRARAAATRPLRLRRAAGRGLDRLDQGQRRRRHR